MNIHIYSYLHINMIFIECDVWNKVFTHPCTHIHTHTSLHTHVHTYTHLHIPVYLSPSDYRCICLSFVLFCFVLFCLCCARFLLPTLYLLSHAYAHTPSNVHTHTFLYVDTSGHLMHVLQRTEITSLQLQLTLILCNSLQPTAIERFSYRSVCRICCNTLKHITIIESLHIPAYHCNTVVEILGRFLQHAATHCNILQHTATHCN